MRALLFLVCASVLLLPGCLVLGATAMVVDTAAGVTGATVGAAGSVARGTVDVLTPGGDKDEDDDND